MPPSKARLVAGRERHETHSRELGERINTRADVGDLAVRRSPDPPCALAFQPLRRPLGSKNPSLSQSPIARLARNFRGFKFLI